jgi:hypothetical protein
VPQVRERIEDAVVVVPGAALAVVAVGQGLGIARFGSVEKFVG